MRKTYHPVQLNAETHAMLKQQAQAAHRSMAQHIQHLLEAERNLADARKMENAEFGRILKEARNE